MQPPAVSFWENVFVLWWWVAME